MFSTKVMGVLAILATLALGALLALQVVEFNLYRAEPSVWPAAAAR